MKITVTDGNEIRTYDVDANEEIENIKALIEAEVNFYGCRHLFHYNVSDYISRANHFQIKTDWMLKELVKENWFIWW